jgi:hypothetical protein
MDLVAYLILDIKVALSKRLIATLWLLDIAGSFDIAMDNRHDLRLRQQSGPSCS